MRHPRLPGRLAAAVLVATATILPSASAQTVETLGRNCVDAGGPQGACMEAAVTAGAVQEHVGLLAGLGSEVAGSASTLGRRLGATPRLAFSLRTGFSRVGMPDLVDPSGPPSRKASFLLPVLHTGVTAGIFDGFSVLPTVGGLLSVDLLGNASFLFLPSGEGFDGRVEAFTFGARFGILRESFTLPGVSVSVTRRDVGKVDLYPSAAAGASSVSVDPVSTSVRATVGKDLMGVGILVGTGWDWYGGSAKIGVTGGGAGPVESTVSDLHHKRTLLFGGASMNFLILQLSTELGWASGLGPVVGYQGAPFDPTAGTFFGSIAFRLTI